MILWITLILLFTFGGCKMEQENTSIEKIAAHVKKHLSLSEKEIDIREIPIPTVPKDYSIYYVEKKESHGNVYYYYVLAENEMFSSADADAFERLLKKEDFLKSRSLD